MVASWGVRVVSKLVAGGGAKDEVVEEEGEGGFRLELKLLAKTVGRKFGENPPPPPPPPVPLGVMYRSALEK